MTVLLFDIGGTNMRLALHRDGVLGKVHKVQTPRYPREALAVVEEFVGGTRIDLIAGGVAGAIVDGVVKGAPNLPGWQDISVERLFADTFRAHTVVLNDADVEALGEALYGAGQNRQLVGYLTIGTGVGGALVVDGALQPAAYGIEPGKQIIDVERGRTLEDLVSGASILRETHLSPRDIPQSFYEARATALAVGVYNLARLWSPDVIVLGGGMILKDPGFSVSRLRVELTRIAGGTPMPELIEAALGDEAGLMGALALVS